VPKYKALKSYIAGSNAECIPKGTKNNYARHIARVALHYKCIPTLLADDQIEDYLEGLILKGSPSEYD